MKRLLFFIVLFVSIPLILSGLTVEQGRIRLVLHEDNGRFSISYLDNIEKEDYVSLLFSRDPRTSSTGLLLNNKIVTLGSSNAFQQRAEKTVSGARFIWTSPQLRIVQSFSFVKSDPNGLADGISIKVEVTNLSEAIQNVGLHLLFDTYLGEGEDAHFVTSDNIQIENETGYTLRMPQYWMSHVENWNFSGLQSVLKGSGITLPDRVVFSNWKRLSESLWNIQVQDNRNFNLLPYSINDSAVCQFYDPIKLSPAASRTIVALLGAYTGTSFSSAGAASGADGSIGQVLTAGASIDAEDIDEAVQQDLIAVNDIISNIDSLLSFPDEITEEKIEIIRRAVQNLNARKQQYQSSQ